MITVGEGSTQNCTRLSTLSLTWVVHWNTASFSYSQDGKHGSLDCESTLEVQLNKRSNSEKQDEEKGAREENKHGMFLLLAALAGLSAHP